ncbi:hypothetical protein RCL1_003019 [Eukaryota sp. TZLM3-RCL]
MLHNYDVLSIIGEGSYGVVLRCRDKETHQIVAIKRFKSSGDEESINKISSREIKMLRMLQHNNIVKLLKAFKHKGRLYLVFDYAERNMLEVLEASKGGLPLRRVRWFMFQLLSALSWVHHNGVLHRDIKLENLLVTDSDTLLLCDFGFARRYSGKSDSELTEYVATRWYRSPSLLLGLAYSSKVDIWASACVLAELATGEPLFAGDSDVDQLALILSSIGPLPAHLVEVYHRHPRFRTQTSGGRRRQSSREEFFRRFLPFIGPLGVDLLQKMLDLDETRIISAKEALEHPFFEEYTKDAEIMARVNSQPLEQPTPRVTTSMDHLEYHKKTVQESSRLLPSSLTAVASYKALPTVQLSPRFKSETLHPLPYPNLTQGSLEIDRVTLPSVSSSMEPLISNNSKRFAHLFKTGLPPAPSTSQASVFDPYGFSNMQLPQAVGPQHPSKTTYSKQTFFTKKRRFP